MGNKVEHLGKIYELVFSIRNQAEKELVKKSLITDLNILDADFYKRFNKEVKP